jgi:hypothetical protein
VVSAVVSAARNTFVCRAARREDEEEEDEDEQDEDEQDVCCRRWRRGAMEAAPAPTAALVAIIANIFTVCAGEEGG